MQAHGVRAWPDGTLARMHASGEREILVTGVDLSTAHGIGRAYDALIGALSTHPAPAEFAAHLAELKASVSH